MSNQDVPEKTKAEQIEEEIASRSPDIIGQNRRKLVLFIMNGMPGMKPIDAFTMEKMYNMYLQGITFNHISKAFNTIKNTILYVAFRDRWYEKRQEHLTSSAEEMAATVSVQKMRAVETYLNLLASMREHINKCALDYQKTGDSRYLDQIDMGSMNTLLKIETFIQEATGQIPTKSKDATPLMGVQLPQGATVEKINDNTVKITPNESPQLGGGSMLKLLANLERAENQLKEMKKK